jgi:hypothetical protein
MWLSILSSLSFANIASSLFYPSNSREFGEKEVPIKSGKEVKEEGKKAEEPKIEKEPSKEGKLAEAYKDLTRNEKRQIINSKFDELIKALKIEKICPT